MWEELPYRVSMASVCGCSYITRGASVVCRCPQEDEVSLSNSIQEAQAKVHEALLDNINTGAALDALGSLIKATNQYLATKQAAAAAAGDAAAAAAAAGLTPAGPQPLLLRKAAAFMTRILSVMGVLPVSAGYSRCLCDGDSPAS